MVSLTGTLIFTDCGSIVYINYFQISRGHIGFGADTVRVFVASLLSQWMGFDQTCTDTLFGDQN